MTLGLRALSTKYQKRYRNNKNDLELAIIKAKAQLEYIDKKEAYEILIGHERMGKVINDME